MRFDNKLKRLDQGFIFDQEKIKKQVERNKKYTEKLQAKK